MIVAQGTLVANFVTAGLSFAVQAKHRFWFLATAQNVILIVN
jgi:hypothetical protein